MRKLGIDWRSFRVSTAPRTQSPQSLTSGRSC
jgi:hypothetical protein